MYYKNNQKIRKVRANELESDIDYNPISLNFLIIFYHIN